ncbi:Cullin repeat-like-containing domain protein [Lipomyces oligophaga]|uniref:Cullin repeat-like-containing domain protein n=1 Tax=Lipomyces oligophaga TaxID=45792 RepID=UPI0034CEA847
MSRPQLVRIQTSDLPSLNGISEEYSTTLQSALLKADLLSKQIAESLNRLGGASTAIETAIKPISGSTQIYSNISKNVESTISELEEVRSHQAVFEAEEPRIRRGNMDVFESLESINRLNEAITLLEGSSLKSSQQVILKMKQLKVTAVSNIRERYGKTLTSISPLASPGGDESRFDPSISAEDVSSLSAMIDFFIVTESTLAVPIYVDIRKKYIISHLSVLSDVVMKNDIARGADGYYQKGTTPFKIFAGTLAKSLVREQKNVHSLFKSPSDSSAAIVSLYTEAEHLFSTTVNYLSQCVRKSLIQDAFLAFDVLEITHSASGDLLLEIDNPPINLESSAKEMHRSAEESLKEILRYIEGSVKKEQQLPADFKVLDISKRLAAWLSHLGDYDMILASIMISMGPPDSWQLRLSYNSTTVEGTASSNSKTSTPRSSYIGPEMLALFIAECVDDLLSNIELKARVQYKKETRVGLQIIANLVYLERRIRASPELLGIVSAGGGFDRIDVKRKRALNMFLVGWKQCASFLMDVTVVRTNSTSSASLRGGMSGREREAVKEKFRNFNQSFDELVQKFREYGFLDPDLRSYLAKEVSFLSPLYGRFYEKYKSGEFSKHTEKYIKYTKTQLDDVLVTLGR